MIGSVSPEQTLASGVTSATVWAKDVTTTGTIDKVLAVITPPSDTPNTPVQAITKLPSVILTYKAATGRYEGVYNSFVDIGLHRIAIYAIDKEGNISLPSVTRVIATKPSPGNISGDDNVDLTDLIVALRVVSGVAQDNPVNRHGDVNNDRKIGLQEAIYILQKAAGIR